ncbi:MAG: PQQ-dependent sugar dehydrogenase [Acidobacteriota bacterium]
MNIRLKSLAAPAALLLSALAAFSQQKVPFANGIPVAPTGLSGKKLPAMPVTYQTAEGMNIRVSAVTTELEYPFGLAFLPDRSILVTERSGKLRIVRDGKLDPKPVAGGPLGYGTGDSGMPGAVHGYMDVVLHPQFATNHWIYLSYTKPLSVEKHVAAVARATWDGKALTQLKDIIVTDGAGPTRLVFGRDNMLYLSVSGDSPQTLKSEGGKVLRINDDGSIPKDNPFVGRADAKPEIFTYGHRNSLGLAMHPGTGEIWQNENGPNGGDEINILHSGLNYGWPAVSYGRTYQGAWQSERAGHAGYEPPVVYWMPAIGVSGMTFYTGDRLAKWKGDVFVGALRTGEIPGTGHLERILFNEKMEELRREYLLTDLGQRIRDVRQGPDGCLYVLTDEKQGALLKIDLAQ